MKKVLLSVLVSAAIVCSATGKTNNFSNRAGSLDNTAKQQLNIDPELLAFLNGSSSSSSSSSSSLPFGGQWSRPDNSGWNEHIGCDLDDLGGLGGNTGGSSSNNDDDDEGNGGVIKDFDKDDLGHTINEGGVSRPEDPIIIGPYHDDTGVGEGGSGGEPTFDPDLPIYHDNEDWDTIDDFYYQTNLVGNEGLLKGTIEERSSNDAHLHNVGTIDIDWYRFSITERLNFEFKFYAPNSGYVFNLYKYSFLSGWGKGHESWYYDPTKEHNLLYTSTDYYDVHDSVLEPATYFICVTVNTAESIDSESYFLEYKNNDNFENKEITEFRLTQDNINNFQTILWENDYTPDPDQRWKKEEENEICRYCDGNNNLWVGSGSLDPIFMKNKNYRPHDYLTLHPDDNLYLDSITYICDINAINEYKDKILEMQKIIDKDDTDKRISAIQAQRDETKDRIVNGCREYAVKLISYIPKVGAIFGKVLDYVTLFFTGLDMIKAFNEMVEFNLNGVDEYQPLSSQIQRNSEMLRQQCISIVNEYNKYGVQDRVIKIPKYRYLRELYINGDTVIKRFTTPYVFGLYQDDHFIEHKNAILTRKFKDSFTTEAANGYVKDHYLDYEFAGTISVFDTFQDYEDYTKAID